MPLVWVMTHLSGGSLILKFPYQNQLVISRSQVVIVFAFTFSQEKVKVVGRSYEECVETMNQNDPELNKGSFTNCYSGMKTTTHDPQKILSSYEEWLSFQESKN